MTRFVHLHNHTHYSLLDALPKPIELLRAAARDEQPACALTDHGVMYGAFEFYKSAGDLAKEGLPKVKPIIGMEAYVAFGHRGERENAPGKIKKKHYAHLVLLAKDQAGYKNLMKLTSLAHIEGFYYKPRIDKELLERFKDGLVATSACMGGVINRFLTAGDFDKAVAETEYYRDLFGDDFYLELQNHHLANDPMLIEKTIEISRRLGVKLIATNDVHYIDKKDAVAHNVLLLIRDATAATAGQNNINDLRYGSPEMYFRSGAEMAELFADVPEALENTLEIADKCDLKLDFQISMPAFPVPPKYSTPEDYLKGLVYDGLKERFDGNITEEIETRAEYELNVINTMGFAGYFLIVWDFIRAAREMGVRVGPGRGSAAGSLVAYALGITNVDPLPYALLFERFLNPERVSMPDIDIDFADDKRDRVINYVKDKYGADAVAQIVTFGKLSSRAVITDVGRVLGVDLTTVKNITSKIPVILGKVRSVKEALASPELSWWKDSDDPKLKQLADFAVCLENRNRNTGIHAAGVVIAPGDITDYVPIFQPSKTKGQSVEIATQYSMKYLEDGGLLKMDFLGLRTLTVISNTLAMIEANHGEKIDIDKIDFNDERTYEMLSCGDTYAVFQFESSGMREYLKQLRPGNLEEITAMNALYRPGPMDQIPHYIARKLGREKVTYLHPIMEKSLKNTFGIIVYQEQVMQLVQHIADFTLGQADLLRRAMGKKNMAGMNEMKPDFFNGALKKGIDAKCAQEIWDLLFKFADYGFNKSHALVYSYLAYQTAWLKAHYPTEFFAANMTNERNDQKKIVELKEEAKKFGIKLLPPDINNPSVEFVARDGKINFGMSGVKNVGASAVEAIVRAREADGEFKSFYDFCVRLDSKALNRRTLEALICAGAFDTIHPNRRSSLMASIDVGLEYSKRKNSSDNMGMDSLFGGGEGAYEIPEPALIEAPEWDPAYRLEKESEFLNFYVSGHPLDKYQAAINQLTDFKLLGKLSDEDSEVEEGTDNTGERDNIHICGLIREVRTRMGKDDQEIAFVQIEDYYGKAECAFWSDTFGRCREFLKKDEIIYITGKATQFMGSDLKLSVYDAMPMEKAVQGLIDGYKIWIDLNNFDETALKNIKASACDSPEEKLRLYFFVRDESRGYKRTYIADQLPLSRSNDCYKKLEQALGKNGTLAYSVKELPYFKKERKYYKKA
ncbi:MAG: DNA polymerase III subunit alpha [Chloroflexota bacterium]